jgi:hypothetical protein
MGHTRHRCLTTMQLRSTGEVQQGQSGWQIGALGHHTATVQPLRPARGDHRQYLGHIAAGAVRTTACSSRSVSRRDLSRHQLDSAPVPASVLSVQLGAGGTGRDPAPAGLTAWISCDGTPRRQRPLGRLRPLRQGPHVDHSQARHAEPLAASRWGGRLVTTPLGRRSTTPERLHHLSIDISASQANVAQNVITQHRQCAPRFGARMPHPHHVRHAAGRQEEGGHAR